MKTRADVPAVREALAPRSRRVFLQTLAGGLLFAARATAAPAPLTAERVIDALARSNERFRTGRLHPRRFQEQMRATASAQSPSTAVLGCIDSRAPAEFIFDAGIGDLFNARIAGNVVNDDLVGSMEFACAASTARVVLVLGHTACGAIKGAIDRVELGKLSGLLEKIRPAIDATEFAGEKSSKNPAYVDAVARTNVRLGVEAIRKSSITLADLERAGTVRIAGAMYDIAAGNVEFLN